MLFSIKKMIKIELIFIDVCYDEFYNNLFKTIEHIMFKIFTNKSILLLCCTMVFLAENLYAQYPMVRNFNRKTSNSGAQNWDIIQDKNDWIYFANNSGLLEFDGNDWSIYSISNYTNVRSVYYDKENERIYAGAFNEFGYFKRDKYGKMTYTSLIDKLEKKHRNFNEIWNIKKQANTIYFQSDHFIFRYENERITSSAIKDRINKIAVINNLLLLATEKNGVFIFNDNMLMPLPNNELLKNKKICAILPYQNKILFLTELSGIFLFDWQHVRKMNTDIDTFIQYNQVFCGAIKNNILAIGTVQNGIVIKDLEKDTEIYSNTQTGLQNNTVLSVNFDRLGNLWLGLDKGIDFLYYNSPVYDVFGNKNSYGTGYASILKGNKLYLGTNQGLYTVKYPFLNQANGQEVKPIKNIQGQIWNLYTTDNTLFCGADRGTYIINNDNAEKIEPTFGTWGFRVFPSKPDYLLASSYNGFFIMKKTSGKWNFSHNINGFKEYSFYFEIDDESHIWLGHWRQGVFRLTLNETMDSIVKTELFDASKGLSSSYNNRVTKIDNQIIISGEKGFYTYDCQKKQIVRSTFLEKLFGVTGYSVELYKALNGDIWNVSNNQITHAIYQAPDTYHLKSTGFTMLKGKLVPGFEHINSLDSNKVLIGTEDGFSIIKLQKQGLNNDTSLNIIIKKVFLTEKKDSLVTSVVTFQEENVPRFKASQNSLRFEFSATEYRKDDAISYSYKLEGFDHEWSEFSPARTKEYTNLKKGTYIFRVKAKNSYNLLTAETAYTFIILPAWYESVWAKIIYTLLIFIILYLIIRYFEQKYEKKVMGMKEIKEQEMKEQEKRFLLETKEKEKEIINLKNQKLQYELRHKSQDLATSTMNLIRKNEALLEINRDLEKISSDIQSKKEPEKTIELLKKLQIEIKKNIQHDNSWKKFQENFDMVYENYLKRLAEQYPTLTVSDKKLCAYLKMDLSSKEIAPLLNMSYRSVEMSRYRLRKKLNLSRDANLTDFLQKF